LSLPPGVATGCQLYDIADVEAFTRGTLYKSGLALEHEEQEELVAEGICILYQLAEHYEPHRNGYASAGCFSGFAAVFQPRRLGDVWHSRHPEHRYRTTENGKRAWEYSKGPVTLDDDNNPITVVAPDAFADGDVVRGALALLDPWERYDARKVVDLYKQGQLWTEIARELQMTRDQLRALCIRLGQKMSEVRRDT
jgi:hypothetical protein